MADTLRTRVARVIAGGAHAVLDKLEDAAPVAMLEQSVREVEQVTDDVRSELGRVVANRHLAQQQHLHLNKEHDALSASLATALAEGRDDLAKPAIARQIDIEAQLPILESSLSQLAQEEKEMSGFVDALMGKKREMEKAIRDFEASRRAAESAATAKGSAGSTAQARVQTAQSAFDRTYQRQTGLDAAGRGATLEQAAKLRELNDLVRDNKINERLAALKAAK
jgi:phage shock protein A